MDKNSADGKWLQVKGMAREFWGEVTGDGVEFEGGLRERMIGRLQEKSGKPKDEAAGEIDDLLTKS